MYPVDSSYEERIQYNKSSKCRSKALFQEFGVVQSCSLLIDRDSGASKGFGFIEMPKSGEAKAAIKNLNNKTIGSNKIRVKKAENTGASH
jgi:RNA recognition motif-containing protein